MSKTHRNDRDRGNRDRGLRDSQRRSERRRTRDMLHELEEEMDSLQTSLGTCQDCGGPIVGDADTMMQATYAHCRDCQRVIKSKTGTPTGSAKIDHRPLDQRSINESTQFLTEG